MTKKKIVLAGCGLVGKRHISAIDKVVDAELVGIVDISESAGNLAQARQISFGVDLSDMLKRVNPDGVILATPTPMHVEQAMTAVQQGCAVLVEKPLATHAHDAERLIWEADKTGVPILVGHHRRHNPLVQKAHELIRSGEIGTIRTVHAQCWLYKPDHYFEEAPWRKEKGAGPVSVNLVHDVDLIRYLCGEVVEITAFASPSSRGFANEEVSAAIIRFENNALGTLSVTDGVVSPWSWELTAQEYPVYPATQESCYRIGGTTGSLSIPDLTVWNQHGQQDWWQPIHAMSVQRDNADPLVNQIEHFVQVMAGSAQPLVSGHEGLKTLKVIESIQISAQTGETIRV